MLGVPTQQLVLNSRPQNRNICRWPVTVVARDIFFQIKWKSLNTRTTLMILMSSGRSECMNGSLLMRCFRLAFCTPQTNWGEGGGDFAPSGDLCWKSPATSELSLFYVIHPVIHWFCFEKSAIQIVCTYTDRPSHLLTGNWYRQYSPAGCWCNRERQRRQWRYTRGKFAKWHLQFVLADVFDLFFLNTSSVLCCLLQGNQKQRRLQSMDPLLPRYVFFLSPLPGLVWQLKQLQQWTVHQQTSWNWYILAISWRSDDNTETEWTVYTAGLVGQLVLHEDCVYKWKRQFVRPWCYVCPVLSG